MTPSQLKKLVEEQAGLIEKKEAGTITDVEQQRLSDVTVLILEDEELVEAEKALAAEKKAQKEKKKEYEVPVGEEGYFHVSQWKGDRFDPRTGKEVASKTVQKYSPADFANFKKYAPSLGYTIEILHEPVKK